MRVIMKMKWNAVTPKLYEDVKKSVQWDTNPPKGLLLHLVGFSNGAMHITDIWESEEEFEDFTHNRLMAGVSKTNFNGILPEIEVFPVHAAYSTSGKDL